MRDANLLEIWIQRYLGGDLQGDRGEMQSKVKDKQEQACFVRYEWEREAGCYRDASVQAAKR